MTGSDMGQLLLSFMQVIFAVSGALASILAGLAYSFAAAGWILSGLITLAVGAFVLALVCHVLVRIGEHRYYEGKKRQQPQNNNS